jgi:sugar/nucleoside kinase (ribokinase family)
MAEAVVAGHTCLDIIPDLSGWEGTLERTLVPGKLVEIGPALTVTGGAVPNTGLALHRLGVTVRLMGKVGDDLFGRAILDHLRRHGEMLADGMIVAGGESSSYTVVLNPTGIDRMFLHCTGANDTFVADDIPYSEIAGAKLFHFGYPPLMRGIYAGNGRELADMFERVKRQGVTTSLDMAKPDPDSDAGRQNWEAILRRTLPYVDVFLPSFEELLFMLDRADYDALERQHGPGGALKGADADRLSRLSGMLIGMGTAIVGIKLGEHGLYLRTSADASRLAAMGACAPADPAAWTGRELLAPCFRVDVAGTTGAGDCTIAGFLAGLLRGLSPERTIIGAVAVGACNVERADAVSGVPDWETVQRRIAAGWERRATGLALHGWMRDAATGLCVGPGDAGLIR